MESDEEMEVVVTEKPQGQKRKRSLSTHSLTETSLTIEPSSDQPEEEKNEKEQEEKEKKRPKKKSGYDEKDEEALSRLKRMYVP